MEKWVTVDDIRNIRQITSHIDDVQTIDPYILETQRVEVQRLLGIRFFNVVRKGLEEAVVEERFTKLLNGATYILDEGTDTEIEIEYTGMVGMIAYYAYARAIPNLGKKVARHGVVKKTTNFSEHLEPAELADLVLSAKTQAKVYEESLLFYLENNADTYPEFFVGTKNRVKSSIRISSVGKNTLGSYE